MSETTMEVQEKEQSEQTSEGERERPTEEPSSGKSASSTSKQKSGRGRALLIFAVVLLIAAAVGILYWLHARQFEDTDDAQIDGNLSPIGTRIDGNIVKVYVQNNQLVKVGDPLVDLDPRDNQVSLDQADAKVKQAESILSSARVLMFRSPKSRTPPTFLGARADVAGAEAAIAAAERRSATRPAAQVPPPGSGQHQSAERSQALSHPGGQRRTFRRSILTNTIRMRNKPRRAWKATRSALLAADRTVEQRRAQLEQVQSKLEQTERTAEPQLLVRRANVESSASCQSEGRPSRRREQAAAQSRLCPHRGARGGYRDEAFRASGQSCGSRSTVTQ